MTAPRVCSPFFINSLKGLQHLRGAFSLTFPQPASASQPKRQSSPFTYSPVVEKIRR